VTRKLPKGSSGALLLAAGLTLPACELLSTNGLSGGTPPREEDASSADGSDTVDGSVHPDGGTDSETDGGASDGRVTCGPDGGGILCAGQCVDPTTDPRNCNGCGNTCATGACGTTVAAPMTTAPKSWTFNGSAAFNAFAPSAELTPIANSKAGTVVYDDPVVVDSFTVTFQFRMGLGGGSRSDGIGFMIEQEGASALGAAGPGLGMTGLTGYGVELDIQDNAVCGDTSSDHVGIDDLSVCPAKAGMPTSLFAADVTSTVDLADAKFHAAQLSLAKGALTVSIDGNTVVTDVKLPNLSIGTPYYFGFAGGTGNLLAADGGIGGYRQEVKDVVITFPTPRCL
jgi:hypothetical protein